MLTILAVSLALTLVFEVGFALLWGLRGRRELALVALVNCLTNPPVVLLYHTAVWLLGWNPLLVTAALESAALLDGAFHSFLYDMFLEKEYTFQFPPDAAFCNSRPLLPQYLH